MPVGISEKLHFPTCSCDWDLEYLAECKVTNRGTSHHCRQSPNLFQIQQAWLVICSLGIVSTLQTIFMIGRRPGLLKLNFRRYLQRGGDCRKKNSAKLEFYDYSNGSSGNMFNEIQYSQSSHCWKIFVLLGQPAISNISNIQLFPKNSSIVIFYTEILPGKVVLW